jgi:hypothetical protein
MPKGHRFEEFGRLLRKAGSPYLFLQRDDGGVWRLDGALRDQRLIGQRVHVVGIRADFDLIDVESINAA